MKRQSAQRTRSGFTLMIVLAVLLTFAALYPLVYLQSNDGLKRLQLVGTATQIYWSVQGAAQQAQVEAASRTYAVPPQMVGFTQVSTYTLAPGDFRLATFTIQVQTIVTPNPARSDEWLVSQPLILLQNGSLSEFSNSPPVSQLATFVTPRVTFELSGTNQIIATFSREMGPSILNPLNFSLSGAGTGTLAIHPTSVTELGNPTDPLASHTYQLTWDTGADIPNQPIQITLTNVGDSQGNLVGGVVGTCQGSSGSLIGIVNVGGIRSWSDGTSASTAKEYLSPTNPNYAYAGAIGDGLYRIQTAGGPINVWCDMTTDSGGWMCVGHYRYPTTENAPADLDDRDYAYFMLAGNNAAYGRPEYYGDPNSAGTWTDWRPLANLAWPAEFAITLDAAPVSGWGSYAAKVIYQVKTRAVMPHYGITQDLTSGDNLYYRLDFTTGWTDVGFGSVSSAYYWYPKTSTNAYLTLFYESNDKYKFPAGLASNNHFTIFYGNGVLGGNLSWYHSGRFYVR